MRFRATAAAIVVAALAVSISALRAEVLVVPSTSIAGVYTSALSVGVTYEIIVEGTYCWDSNCFRADAEWYDQNNGTWIEHPPGDPARETFELNIDNAAVAWEGDVDGAHWAAHVLSPTHRYRTFLVGSGAPVKLHIADTYPYEHSGGYDWTGDNSGSLTATVTEAAAPHDGSIVAWGRNDLGESSVPGPNANFVGFSAGVHHALGLTTQGSVVAWGDTSFGAIPSPNEGFVALASGQWHDLGLRTDGSIAAWGENFYGQLNVPAPNQDFVAVAAGDSHSLGLKSSGVVVGWGNNVYGQLTPPAPNTGFTAIAAGTYHSVGLKSDGSVVAWGYNGDGQCDVPAPNEGFVAVAAGFTHSLGLKVDGSIVAWGSSGDGRLAVPEPNSGYVAIAAGEFHSLALRADGSVVAWGTNLNGECVVPEPNVGFVAVSGGERFSLALRAYPGGACCAADGSCTYATEQSCTGTGVYAGDGTYCYPDPCPPPGACCLEDGTCVALTESACVGNAIWQGAESSCNPNPCTSGACCLHGFCTRLGSAECHGYGGSYEGNGTVCTDSTCATSGVELPTAGREFQLTASPNPFSGSTTISFWLARPGWTSVRIYDAGGRLVSVLGERTLAAGLHEVMWDGTNSVGRRVQAGVFWVRVDAAGSKTGKRLLLIR